LRNYEFILSSFQTYFGDIELSAVTSEDILAFMSTITDGTKQNTKKLRFTLLSAFFNFVKNSLDTKVQNPCESPVLKKLFRASKLTQFKILEKDVIDEIIFRTSNQRNRLMLELMARSGMRVGEVLKLKPLNICEGTLPPMHPDPAHRLKLCLKCCYVIRIFQPLSGIWEQ